MRAFVGWVPTVTGRLSFSRVGDAQSGDRAICNNTATVDRDGFLFGSHTRTSHDGPFPAFIMRWMGRVPDVHYLVSMRVDEAMLPVQALKQQSDDPKQAPVNLELDREGALTGEIVFFSLGKALPRPIGEKMQRLRQLAREGRAPSCTQVKRREKRDQAEAIIGEIWDELKAGFGRQEKLPAFGRVHVRLLRTGQCEMLVDEDDLHTTRAVKVAQSVALAGGILDRQHQAFQVATAAAARQCFFFLRDLAHRHYHHHPNSDLLTTTYAWALDEDEHWRRETQYGLVRLAISERRRDTAETFKRALGIIAYAEAFQKHLCGWLSQFDAPPVRSPLGFAYDFASLRASIDASLKVRELKDNQRRQTFLFVFGFVVTCLGLVVAGLRTLDEPPDSAAPFITTVAFLTAYPVQSLVGAAILASALDLAFLRVSLRPPYLDGWTGGLGRAVEAVMGSLMWRRVSRGAAYAAGILIIAAVVSGALAIAAWAYREAFHLVTPPAG
jgi:hypothetical protein